MKITANNSERADIANRIEKRVAIMRSLPPHQQPTQIPRDIAALSLARSRDEADYIMRFQRLMSFRDAVGLADWHPPDGTSTLGRLKTALYALAWKLVRPPVERLLFRQNLINSQLASAAAFEIQQRDSEIAELKARLKRLEQSSRKRTSCE